MNIVPEKLYYIYMDTKIIGAVEQLVRYFQAQIFTQDACICVLCKYYKDIEKSFSKKFNNYNINFKFIKKHSDIQLEKNKTVFYLFNAQSNCRLVADRNLTHIFVTHGESHKLASIKPIIRIYDYVVTSGQVGIERYLKSGIFSEHDIKSGKVITLGNTFIGNNKYIYDEHASALVYAPTWEGGIPDEDYCSISYSNTKKIIDFCHLHKINTVYLQPHPNLGHRVKSKRNDLLIMTSTLEGAKITVHLIGGSPVKSMFNFFSKKHKSSLSPEKIPVKYALTDISAMEVQFLSKGIPCGVFAEKEIIKTLSIPKALKKHYNDRFIYNEIIKHLPLNNEIYNYFFSYPSGLDASTPFNKRIYWLCNHTWQERTLREKQLYEQF